MLDLKFNLELINLVKKTPILYNTSHPNHRELRERHQAWIKIANELNVDVSIAKKRFRALKDRFVRERRLGTRSWKLYGQLLWLSNFVGNENRQSYLRLIRKKSQVICKAVKEETPDPLTDTSYDVSTLPDVPEPWNSREIFAVSLENGHHDESEISTLNTKRKKKTTGKTESSEDGKDCNDTQDLLCKKFRNDEDTLFVLSLVPALKRMSRIEKNQAKIKILEIISEHDNDDNVSANSSLP